MNLYKIIGLSKKNVNGISYETDSKNYILIDDNGHGITKRIDFTHYIIYILFENLYYSIHLSKYDCASFSGKMCCIGMMKILDSNYTDATSNITHYPIKPLFIFADFEIKEYSYDESIDIYLHEDLNTFLFKFSSIGDNEKDPCGYVYVNMDLFQDSL